MRFWGQVWSPAAGGLRLWVTIGIDNKVLKLSYFGLPFHYLTIGKVLINPRQYTELYSLPTSLGFSLCRVQVNSEQVSLESLAEAGERLGRPDMSRELIALLRSQNREELGLGRAMFGCF